MVTKLRADGTKGNTLFDNKTVSSSNSTAVSASVSSGANAGVHSNVVDHVARPEVIYGSQKLSTYTLPTNATIVLNGTSISLASGDSLSSVAGKINSATYLTNQEMRASIIDNRLVLSTKSMGSSAAIFGTADGSPPFNNAVDDPNNILSTELGVIDGAE